MTTDIKSICKRIKLILLDVDGVLTNGKIHLLDESSEFKSFHVHDGAGIVLAKAIGIEFGIITGRSSKAVSRRAAELGISIVIQDCADKLAALDQICKDYGYAYSEIAYIGDDWPDIPILKSVGLSLTVANACEEVKQIVFKTSTKSGGEGGVRELIEWIIDARNEKKKALNSALKSKQKSLQH